VGDATLTEKQFAEGRDTRGEQFARQYVSNWVTAELLYQEARQRGFSESDEVVQQVEQAKKQFAINAYLEKVVFSDDSSDVEDATLLTEFQSHRETYRLREDLVRMSFAIFEEREAANTFRSAVLRGLPWNAALQEIKSDPDASVLRAATSEYFTQSLLYPEELWKIARTLMKEDVSYVVKTNVGYCVAIVHGTYRQGDLPELDVVRNEVRERVLLKRRKAKYNEVLALLRTKYEVEVRLVPTDSAENATNE
jgi:hypothetical protein